MGTLIALAGVTAWMIGGIIHGDSLDRTTKVLVIGIFILVGYGVAKILRLY